jgi:hypothetical protein
MMTWRWWQTLKNPPASHPLFLRIKASSAGPQRKIIVASLIGIAMFEIATFLLSVFSPTLQSLALIFSLIIPAALLVMTFNSTLYAMQWTASISGAIAREHEMRRYDLLCLLPIGAAGTCMVICAGCLDQDSTFKNIPRFERMPISRSQASFLVIVALLVLLRYFSEDRPSEIVFFIVFLIAAMTGFLVDYVQAAVMATLTGILTPTYIHGQNDARLLGALGFLLIQISTYLLTLVAGLVIIPVILDALHISDSIAKLSLPIIVLATFCGVREAAVFGLQSMVTQRLKAA